MPAHKGTGLGCAKRRGSLGGCAIVSEVGATIIDMNTTALAMAFLVLLALGLGFFLGTALARAQSRTELHAARTSLEVNTQHWESRLAAAEARQATAGAVSELVTPLRASLGELATRVAAQESARAEGQGRMEAQLRALTEGHRLVADQTAQVTAALRNPGVRGRWGEVQLTRIVESAGLLQGISFHTQVGAAGGTLRPDMVVDLGAGRTVVIDAKVPLDALLSAYADIPDPPSDPTDHMPGSPRDLGAHAAAVRRRIHELAGKDYAAQFGQSPNFVVLFLPADAILTAALECDPSLVEDAFDQGVLLATPTTLLALLRMLHLAWQSERNTANAAEILALASQAVERISLVAGHLQSLGAKLDATVSAYNKVAGSWQSRLRPVARKLTDAGIDLAEQPQLSEIDTDVRRIEQLRDAG